MGVFKSRFLVRNSSQLVEAFLSFMPFDIPFSKESFYKLDKNSCLSLVYWHNVVYIFLHVRSNVSDGAHMINRVHTLGRDASWRLVFFYQFAQALYLLVQRRLRDTAKVSDHTLQASAS